MKIKQNGNKVQANRQRSETIPVKFPLIQRWDFQPEVRGDLPRLVSPFTLHNSPGYHLQNDCKGRLIWEPMYRVSATSILLHGLWSLIITIYVFYCLAKMGFDQGLQI